MTDEEAIRRTIAQYCQLCDDGRFEEWADLFTVDAHFHVMGRTYTGRAEIRAFIEAGQPPERRGKHVCANTVLEIAPDRLAATATTDYIFVGRAAGGLEVTSAGRYEDSFAREGEAWRFAERRIVFLAPA